jgi:hypothetical protein
VNTATSAPAAAAPADAADEAAVRAAERSVRRLMRGQYTGFDAGDLRQEGRLAVLAARRAGRVPDDPEHAQRYLARRTQGAMLDYARATRRQIPANAVEWTPEADPRRQPAAPEARLAARDVTRLLRRRGSQRMLECVELLARGLAPSEVALALSVSASRVSQLRDMARRAAAQLMEA